MFSVSWPVLEGVAAYLFLIAVAWSVPGTETIGPLTWSGFLGVGVGGALVCLAYWRERTQEIQQPRFHGGGTALIVLGALAIAISPLA